MKIKFIDNPLLIRFAPYAIVIGNVKEDHFKFTDTRHFMSGVALWEAKRIWRFIYKVNIVI